MSVLLRAYWQAACKTNGKLVLCCYAPQKSKDAKVTSRIHRFDLSARPKITPKVVRYRDEYNVYFGPAIMRPDLEEGRGTLDDIIAVTSIVLDEDLDTGKAVYAPPIEPSFVVHTSSGPAGINRQLHYLFEHPLPPQEAADLARLARQKTGGDNCTIDLAHVWRVPGTYNLPDWRKIARGRSPEPQPVTLAGGTGQPVDPAALRAALEGMPDRVTPAPGAALAEANDGEPVDADALVARISSGVLGAMEIEGAPGKRSDHAADVAVALFREGCTDTEVSALVRAGYAFGAKFQDRSADGLRKIVAGWHGEFCRRGGNVADEFDDLSAETPDGDARAKAERQAARKALLAELPALAKTAPERWLEDAPVNALAWLLISKDGTAKLEKLLREAKEANKSFPLQQVRSAVKAAAKRAKRGDDFLRRQDDRADEHTVCAREGPWRKGGGPGTHI